MRKAVTRHPRWRDQWRGCKTRTAVYSIAAVWAISLALRLVEIAAALIRPDRARRPRTDRHFTLEIVLNVEPAARLADQSYAGNYMSGRKSDKAHDPNSAHFHHSHSVIHFCLCRGCEQRRLAHLRVAFRRSANPRSTLMSVRHQP